MIYPVDAHDWVNIKLNTRIFIHLQASYIFFGEIFSHSFIRLKRNATKKSTIKTLISTSPNFTSRAILLSKLYPTKRNENGERSNEFFIRFLFKNQIKHPGDWSVAYEIEWKDLIGYRLGKSGPTFSGWPIHTGENELQRGCNLTGPRQYVIAHPDSVRQNPGKQLSSGLRDHNFVLTINKYSVRRIRT